MLADVVVGALFTESVVGVPHTIAIQAEDQNSEEELRRAQGDHEVDAHSGGAIGMTVLSLSRMHCSHLRL